MQSPDAFPEGRGRAGEPEVPLSDMDLARVIHEANRGLNIAMRTMVEDAPFDAISPEHKDVILDRVRAIRMGLPPEEIHNRWAEYWLNKGWTTGPKDPEQKTHPCLVPYSRLPARQKQKVIMACRIVYTLTMEGY